MLPNKKEPQRETLIRHVEAIGQILQKEGTPHNLVIIDAYSYRITSDELGGSINEVIHSDKN